PLARRSVIATSRMVVVCQATEEFASRSYPANMNAKQTLLSASLVLVCASRLSALADPDNDVGPEPADTAPPPPSDGKTGTFEIGAGYASDDGFMALARVEIGRASCRERG